MIYDCIVIGAGQAGLATAYQLQRAGLSYLVLNEGTEPTGSWPRYYRSLRLFSPAQYASLPGMPFPGDPDRYPLRDEVTEYLRAYAKKFDLQIQNDTRVAQVRKHDALFEIEDGNGARHSARTVVAASGSFNCPHIPKIPGLDEYEGTYLHSVDYDAPDEFEGKRVVVVGSANSAVQIAVELAQVADTSIAVRDKISFCPQRILGKDLHFWLGITGLDRSRFLKDQSTPVMDSGAYSAAIRAGNPDERPMFRAVHSDGVQWAGGTREKIDAIIFATGFRPNADYLAAVGMADGPTAATAPGGICSAVPGLYFVGFSGTRSFSSATLRGVGRDSEAIVRTLRTQIEHGARAEPAYTN